MSILAAVANRRSLSSVTDEAPDDAELARLVTAASSVADHAALGPWRLVTVRGSARERLGAAFVEASGLEGKDADTLAKKPLRAPLLVAIIAVHHPNFTVPEWEQDAVASGIGHVLSLLLDNAGWGVMWRTGGLTNAPAVRELHALDANEKLFGWLYVGGRTGREKSAKPRPDASDRITAL